MWSCLYYTTVWADMWSLHGIIWLAAHKLKELGLQTYWPPVYTYWELCMDSGVCFENVLCLFLDNIKCEGEGVVEQAEFCHYSHSSRDKCGPPAILLLEGINISPAVPGPNGSEGTGKYGLCSCQFNPGGKRVCLLGKDICTIVLWIY